MQAVAIDRQPDQAHVGLAGPQPDLLDVLLQRHQLERCRGKRSRQTRAHLSGVAPVTKPTRKAGRGAASDRGTASG